MSPSIHTINELRCERLVQLVIHGVHDRIPLPVDVLLVRIPDRLDTTPDHPAVRADQGFFLPAFVTGRALGHGAEGRHFRVEPAGARQERGQLGPALLGQPAWQTRRRLLVASRLRRLRRALFKLILASTTCLSTLGIGLPFSRLRLDDIFLLVCQHPIAIVKFILSHDSSWLVAVVFA